MSEWEPATDAEVAMRNALRTDDQESYFRILAGVDLLLPVSADALAGLEPLGWGTWSTGGRTHVLAFTSPAALQACLAVVPFLLALTGLTAVRAALRRRRGLCPRCAFSLVGATQAGCPECGWGRA